MSPMTRLPLFSQHGVSPPVSLMQARGPLRASRAGKVCDNGHDELSMKRRVLMMQLGGCIHPHAADAD
jgi:hypothetical protein